MTDTNAGIAAQQRSPEEVAALLSELDELRREKAARERRDAEAAQRALNPQVDPERAKIVLRMGDIKLDPDLEKRLAAKGAKLPNGVVKGFNGALQAYPTVPVSEFVLADFAAKDDTVTVVVHAGTLGLRKHITG